MNNLTRSPIQYTEFDTEDKVSTIDEFKVRCRK